MPHCRILHLITSSLEPVGNPELPQLESPCVTLCSSYHVVVLHLFVS